MVCCCRLRLRRLRERTRPPQLAAHGEQLLALSGVSEFALWTTRTNPVHVRRTCILPRSLVSLRCVCRAVTPLTTMLEKRERAKRDSWDDVLNLKRADTPVRNTPLLNPFFI